MAAPETTPDLNSMLTHVNSLESEKKAMQEYLAKQNERIEKLTAGKKAEMKKTLEGMVDGWLNNIDISDEKVKEEFVQGMQGIVNNTKEESGVWQVLCCASAAHKRNVGELQRVTEEYNALKTKVEGGTFHSEEARIGSKRKEPEEPTRVGGNNAWDDFENSLRSGGGVGNYTPDPTVIKDLRREWVPI